MDPVKAVDWVDENTIGVCAILGSTVSFEAQVLVLLCFNTFIL